MAASKPLPLRFLELIGTAVGRERLESKLEWAQNAFAGDAARAASVLGRILGRRPSPDELRAALAERRAVQADVMATLFTLNRAAFDRSLERIALPALDAIGKARAGGKGVILSTPHFGNYVLAITGLARAGIPLTVTFINSSEYKWLEDFGIKVADFGQGALDYTRALAAGEAALVFIDLDFFPGQRTAPFFGAPIRPPHGLARLAEAAGATVLPVYAARDGRKWKLEADAPIRPETADQVERAVLDSAERWIGRRPGHWVLGLDPWDIEGTDSRNRRRLALQGLFSRP